VYALIGAAIVIFVLWLPAAFASLLGLFALWQQKEYRRDRMRSYRSTREGRQLWKGPGRKVRVWFLLIVLILFLAMYLVNAIAASGDSSMVFSYYFVVILLLTAALVLWWGSESWSTIRALATHQFKRPQLTSKMLLLLVFCVPVFLYAVGPLVLIFPGELLFHVWPGLSMLRQVVIALYIPFFYLYAAFGFHVGYAVGLTLLDLLVPSLVAASVGLLSPLTAAGKRSLAKKARGKMQQFPDLRVIAVTGSYGKSSTKELIAALLGSRYKVKKTEKNHNTLIGVSQTILSEVKGDEDFLVVEMGAYTKGEIRELCAVTPPCISVVTAINEQHLSLFGKSLDDTSEAKFEIIEGLSAFASRTSQPAIAVLNADNEHTARMAAWIKERGSGPKPRVYLYSAKGRINAGGIRTALLAINIKQDAAGVHFLLVDNQQEKQSGTGSLQAAGLNVTLKVVRKEMVGNYLAAVCVALSAGMTLSDIVLATSQLPEPLPGTYVVKQGLNGAQIIDESYSSNPDGFLAALEFLKSLPAKRKIVVTRGMIELGSRSDEAHRKVGEKIALSADLLFLTSHESEQEFRQGIGHARRSSFRTTVQTDAGQLSQLFSAQIKADDVILIEGRIPQFLHSLLCRS